MKCVKKNGYSLLYASSKLKKDYDVVIEAIKNYPLSLEYADKKLKNNRNIIRCAVTKILFHFSLQVKI